MMDWNALLSTKRLGKEGFDEYIPERSPFQVDYDRIIFSPAFRRLQDKTQVFPLAGSDFVRTRLTHSLEVASIARSIGAVVGKTICERHKITNITSNDIGVICSAAALIHDIGNPPFGHSGEDAIRAWFSGSSVVSRIKEGMKKADYEDFHNYEGNAQAFRLVSKLQMADNIGGMQLTNATLGAFAKYPCQSISMNKTGNVSVKKFGFFQSELSLFKEMANELSLLPMPGCENSWCRHPLAFLVEAADDITYCLADLEDGFRTGNVTFDDIKSRFISGISDNKEHVDERISKLKNERGIIEYLRTCLFRQLIKEVAECFLDSEETILSGGYTVSITKEIKSSEFLKGIKTYTADKIYQLPNVVQIEAAGFEVAHGLLDAFLECVNDLAGDGKPSAKSLKLKCFLSPHTLDNSEDWKDNPYFRIIRCTDLFCGMTDSFAVNTYRKIKGISLPWM